MWDTVFSGANGFAMVMWAILILLPRTDKILKGLLLGGVGLLSLAYSVGIVGLMSGMLEGGGEASTDFTTIEGVRAIFSGDGGVTIGWIHYLAFDLFVGLWIARDADERGVSRLIQAPILFATLMAGPLGLFLWLALRNALTGQNKELA